MLRYLPRQEWEKRKFSFIRRNSPNIVDWSGGEEDQGVPSGMDPSFRLPLCQGEESPPRGHPAGDPRDAMQLSCQKWRTSTSSQPPLWERGTTPIGGLVTNSVPVHLSTSVLSRSTILRANTVFASTDMVVTLQDFTWWDRGKLKRFCQLSILRDDHHRKFNQDASFHCAVNANTGNPQFSYTRCLEHLRSSGSSTLDFLM